MTQSVSVEPADSAKQDTAHAIARRKHRYEVTAVEKTDEVSGAQGKQQWYRYVISNASSTITGQRCGTLKQVTAHARDFAAQLNDRASSGGRSPYAPRKKAAAANGDK